MSTDTVAPSTWSVGPKTLAAAITIAAIVLAAPATTWFVARHQIRTQSQVAASGDLIARYERLRDRLGLDPVPTRNLRADLDELRRRLPQGAAGNLAYPQTLDALLASAAADRFSRADALTEQALQAEKTLHGERVQAAQSAIFWLYCTIALAAVLTPLTLAWLFARIRRDLLARQWYEQQLEEANRLLESVFENMPAMLFAKDAKTLRFMRINRAAERIIGYPREQLLGRGDYDFFPPEQAEHFTNKDRETLAKGDVLEIPHEEIDTGDHGRRTLHTFKVPIRDRDGNPSLLLGISLDVTQQRAAEQRVVALNEELMRQARLLQSSNEELESFCYSVSHDLRAPLRAINGFARLLEQDYGPRFDEVGARYLRTICNACQRMAQLIDDLLEFSRIGRQTLALEPIDMETVVRKVIEDTTHGNEFRPVISTAQLPSVNGDRTMLHLVWLNLIDNAVKYTRGVVAPRIDITAEQRGDEIIYSVSDNGIGFDMQYADKLFGVFQRLHANPDYPGTGVGLAITQRIVSRHGGRIWAHSEPGIGSTFRFSLPRRETASV